MSADGRFPGCLPVCHPQYHEAKRTRGARTIIKARQTTQQPPTLAQLPSLQIHLPAIGFERLKPPRRLERGEVDSGVACPEFHDGIHPAGCHDDDIGPLARDMAVLGRVVVANEEVCRVGCEVGLVHAA